MLQELVKHYKNKNELEALALSLDNPGAIFFTTDTNSIIIDGKVFGIGSSRLFIGTQSDYDIAVLAGQIQNGAIVIIKPTYLTFTALEDNCSIGFYNNPNSSITPTIEYSFDKNTWSILTEDNVSIEKGQEMYCRGINPDGISGGYGESGYNYFTGEGKFNVSGDIMTIIDYETMHETMVGTMMYMFGRSEDDYVDIVDASNLILNATTLTDDCYANMFDSCSSMIYGPQIKAKILAPFCCYKMFYNCALLTAAPVLSARTMKKECYAYMFYGCTSLTIAPELPATTLANRCYNYMFLSCTSLTTAPEILPATTLADSCYADMFNTCAFLNTAPVLPATTLTQGCYNFMFSGCTSLIAAPALPATTLTNSCYSNMFSYCTSLTAAPELSATTLASNCYNSMFYNCTALTTAPELPATTLTQGCYNSMFYNCTALTTAPELPATTLTQGCYNSMFYNCTSLTTAPELPATTLTQGCYNSMFYNCTSLTTAPELSATTLASNCYSYMFSYCTSLTAAPELPATTLADYCYSYMFYNCTALTTAPELPAATLANYCYSFMFCYCESLTTAPELPATTLTNGCYNWMFYNCTALTTAPELPAATLANYCYSFMFNRCTSINRIKCIATDISATDCTSVWVDGVASTGIFFKHPDMDNWPAGINGIPSGWTVEYALTPYITFTALEDNCSIGFYNNPNSSINPTILYSFDNNTWNTLTDNVLIEKDSKMYCRGINPDGISGGYGESGYNYFTGEGKFNVSGCIMSLINYETLPETMVGTFYNLFGGDIDTSRDNFVDIVDASGLILSAKTLTADCYQRMFSACTSMIYGPQIKAEVLAPYCCWGMFIECTSLVTAPELPATTLAKGCYSNMFSGCTSLTAAPELPATELTDYCYDCMFYECTSLTTAPELHATTLADSCYINMFNNCTSLTTILELPATELALNCYSGMFLSCKSLTTTPELPATTLADSCYSYMFYGCTALTAAPELPAITLALSCYYYMFYNCTALTTIPELPATELALNCYNGMFSGCTSLTAAPLLPATTLADECYYMMFSGCTALTTAPALPATTLAYDCYCFMFQNCTSLVTAPALPATTLADSCYSNMFYGCTSLTTAPEILPATTLARSCYAHMFRLCTSLTTAPELPATTLANNCYYYMFNGCAALTTAPVLPATTLTTYCYYYMFYKCTKLNYIKCLATNRTASYCTTYWLYNVSSTGTFVKHPNMTSWPTGSSSIPKGWAVEDADMSYVTFTAELDGSSIGLERLSTKQTLEYSTDTTTWRNFNPGTNISLNNGDEVYVRGILSASFTPPNFTQFNMTGKIASSGNCNAIWNYEDLKAPLKAYCGYYMFNGCTALTSAPKLPATELANSCYLSMFNNCTALTTAPKLPATELGEYCYSNMFNNCTSLTTAPELPATTLTNGCYNLMFYNCTSLTTAPELPAATLANYSYSYMFNGCTCINRIKCLATDISYTGCTSGWVDGVSSIGIFFKHPDMDNWTTGINGIPGSWTIADMSYVTFTAELNGSSIGLTQLSTNHTLEYITDTATTWNAFDTNTNISLNNGDKVYVRGMLSATNAYNNYTQFKMSGKISASGNCNALWNYQDLDAPLKAYCGCGMFKNCTLLTTAPELPATTLASCCYQLMFEGCTSLTVAPALPATELAGYCYMLMFAGCTSLTAAPELPATVLTTSCYYNMFRRCAKLNYIKCLATDISAATCTYNWVEGLSSTGTFVKHIDMNDWTTGTNGIPSGWDVKTTYTPQECLTLEITADNVSGRKTTTTIYYTATTNGIYDNGDIAEGIIITGTATSNEFEQNTSYTDTIERTITFEFMGVTATTTITQGVWIDQSSDIVLNDQWRLSETQSNPDSELYDGVYESFSNTGVNNSTAIMYIDLTGYTEFDVYIRSYAESNYDYVTISEPNSTTEKASTKGKQNSGQDISSYTRVHYDNLTGEDRITITYRKDSSASNGNDQGYILISKQ